MDKELCGNEKIDFIIKTFKEQYDLNEEVFLTYTNELELLMASILSARCTDRQVNETTKVMFEKYKTVSDYANADVLELEQVIRSCGLYKTKAKNIIATAKKLESDFDSKVPSNLDDLLSFDGVGRKIGNLILGRLYNIPAVVVDTHVKRVSNRLMLSTSSDPHKIEKDLVKLFPIDYYIALNEHFICHGRKICTPSSPSCDACCVNTCCPNKIK